MSFLLLGVSGNSDSPPYEKATDLIYCKQNLAIFNRDIIGTPPYEKATDLIYCKQNLAVFNRTL